ncbi:hypothetical protein ACFVW2_32780 [Streptomyces sp. NPDC058171]
MGVAPDRPVPDVAYVATPGAKHVSGIQTVTEAGVRATLRAPIDAQMLGARNSLLGNLFAGFNGLGSFITGLTNAFTGQSSGGGIFAGIFNHSVAQAQQAQSVQNKVESLLTGGTRTTYGQSGTWVNPGPGRIVGVACIQGGWGGLLSGQDAKTVGGRYVYAEFRSDDLPATVAVTVGGPGSGQIGSSGTRSNPGTSSFGTFVKADGSGSGVLTSQGILLTDSNAGYGGLGQNSERTAAECSGTGNALASGGAFNGSNPGAPGGAAPTNQIAVAGGGGGAGGPSVGALGTTTGGIGGWPGGAGGCAGTVGAGGNPRGGSGAYGAVFVTVKG